MKRTRIHSKRFRIVIVLMIVLICVLVRPVQRVYGEKDNQTFKRGFSDKETFKDSHFWEFNPNQDKGLPPDPPTDDGDPISSPVDGSGLLLVMGTLGLLVFSGKKYKKNTWPS